MSDEKLIQLGPHDRMTVDECLTFCERTKEMFEDVIVVGWDKDGDVIIRSSYLTRPNAVYLLMEAIDNARGK